MITGQTHLLRTVQGKKSGEKVDAFAYFFGTFRLLNVKTSQ